MGRVKLGNISKLINGDRGKNYPSQADITDDGKIPFVNAGHLNGRNIDFSEMNYISQDKYDKLNSGKFQKGDILYCLRGSLGKKAIVNNDVNGAIASSLVIIRPDLDKVTSEYLMLALDSPAIKEQLIKANNGSSQPNLSAASVREYEVELPELSIQKGVVEKLVKVRRVIDGRQQELQLLDDLIKARFVEMFGDRYVNDKNWNIMRLEDSVSFNNGKAHEQVVDENGRFILVTSRAIASDFEDVRKTNALLFPLHKNDIVMVMSDVPNGKALAKCQLIEKDDKYTLNQRICSFDNYEYNPVFLLYLLNRHPYFLSFNDGNGQTNLRKNDILNCELIVPPVELQVRFADFVAQIDKSKVAVQKALDETQMLFDSLMQKYFG